MSKYNKMAEIWKKQKREENKFTVRNPWKTYPPYKPCFCGCGRKAKYCHATKLMPMWTTPEAAVEAKKEFSEMIHHVEALLKKGIFFKDEERAKHLMKCFVERDNPDAKPDDGKNDVKPGVGGDAQVTLASGERDVGSSDPELPGENSGVTENRPS